MDSDERRKRLEALNGGPLSNVPARPPDTAEAETTSRRRTRGARQAPWSGTGLSSAASVSMEVVEASVQSLDACLPGSVYEHADGATHYRIERPLTDHAPWAARLGADLCQALAGEALRHHLRRVTGIHPVETLFLDLETLGLGGEPLFLIGTLRMTLDGVVICRQELARDGGEEPSALAAFAESLREARLLVTFNGTCFDLPVLRARASIHGITIPETAKHLDVLMMARHRYRRQTPDCRLQTLERHLCGRTRTGDVPGREIPAIYRDFVRTGNASRLAAVVQHNLLDLATTADLLTRLWSG